MMCGAIVLLSPLPWFLVCVGLRVEVMSLLGEMAPRICLLGVFLGVNVYIGGGCVSD